MADALYSNSITIEEEDALLASDIEEIEDGEIVDSDHKEEENVCHFVPINDNESDIEIISHCSSKIFNHNLSSIQKPIRQLNHVEHLDENLSVRLRNETLSSRRQRLKSRGREHIFKSIQCSPYDKFHCSYHRSRNDDHWNRFDNSSHLSRFSVSPTRSTSSVSQLLKKFNKVTLSKVNNETQTTSIILTKPILKLPENSVPIKKENNNNNNDHDDDEVSIIAEVQNTKREMNLQWRTFQDLLKDGEKNFENACTKLNNLHISENPNKHLNNIFAQPKPNLYKNLVQEVNKETFIQTSHRNVRQWLDSCVKDNNARVNIIRNNRLIEVNSDGENESNFDIDTNVNNNCYGTYRSRHSGRRSTLFRNHRVIHNNSFFLEPWIRITTPIRNERVRIVFGGVYTLLDKHRIYDLCLENSRYVEDYEINLESGEAIVICRSTDSAMKFIAQRPTKYRKYKIMSVGEVLNF